MLKKGIHPIVKEASIENSWSLSLVGVYEQQNPMTNGSNLEKLLIIRYPVWVPLLSVSCFSTRCPWGLHLWTRFQHDEHFTVFLYWACKNLDWYNVKNMPLLNLTLSWSFSAFTDWKSSRTHRNSLNFGMPYSETIPTQGSLQNSLWAVSKIWRTPWILDIL